MNANNWKDEMNYLMEMFQRESEISLRKINRCFVTSGERAFDDDFRKYFMKVSTHRLNVSFDTILWERGYDHTPMQITSNYNTFSNDNGNGTTNDTKNLSSVNGHVSSLYALQNESVSVAKIENSADDPIEIVDSRDDDEDSAEKQQMPSVNDTIVDTMQSNESKKNRNDELGGGNSGIESGEGAANVKHEPELVIEDELMETCGTNAFDDTNGDQMELNTLQESNNDDDGKPNDEQNDTNANSNSDIEVDEVKCEPKIENEIEIEEMDLEFDEFDPNKENDRSTIESETIAVAESLIDQNQSSSSSSSSNAQKQAKRSDDNRYKCNRCAYTSQKKSNFTQHQLIHQGTKPFKCDRCDYAARQKSSLKTHQRTHDRQKSMGIVKDPNDGLFKCMYCDRQFTGWRHLKIHLTLSHKNNQRLFNCGRCMRRFTRKSEKERHESKCKNRRYECHLCKTYVARDATEMQIHMRTHTGAKPFECAVCNKSFRHKCALKKHLDAIHGRMHK